MGHGHVYKLVRETKTKALNISTSLILVAMSLGGALPAFITNTAHAAGATVSTQSSPNGWSAQDGSPTYVAGPSGADGNGSLRLTTNSQPKQNYFHYTSTPLNGISGLGYKVDVTAGIPASYQLQVIGANGAAFTSLVWEPVYNGQTNGPNGGFVTESNLENGTWWSSSPIAGAPNRSTFVPLSTIIANNPGATIISYGVNVGSGTPNSTSYVDDVSFQSNVTDFEATPPAAPTNLSFVQGAKTLTCDGGAATNSNASGTLHWTAPTGSLNQYAITPNYPDNTGEYTFYAGGSDTSKWVTNNFAHHGEGSYSYTIKAQGANGLWGPAATCSLTYDKTPPQQVTLTSPSDGATVNGQSGVTFTWAGNDSDIQAYKIHITGSDGSVFNTSVAAPGNSYTYTGAQDGVTYTWQVKPYDHAVNYGPWSASWAVTVDNTAPTMDLRYGQNGPIIPSGSTIRTKDNDGNDINIRIKKDNTDGVFFKTPGASSFSGPRWVESPSYTGGFPTLNWMFTQDGTYTFYTQDLARNTSGVYTINVDNTAPKVMYINRHGTDELTNHNDVTFLVKFSEATNTPDATNFTLNTTGSAHGTVSSVTPDPSYANRYYVKVTSVGGNGKLQLKFDSSATPNVTDLAGNPVTEDYAGQSYDIDNAAPTISVRTMPANGAHVSNNLSNPAHSQQFAINATDTHNIASATLHLVDANGIDHVYSLTQHSAPHPEDWFQYINLDTLSDGTYQVWFEATDTVGNTAYYNYNPTTDQTLGQRSIIVDNTAPNGTFMYSNNSTAPTNSNVIAYLTTTEPVTISPTGSHGWEATDSTGLHFKHKFTANGSFDAAITDAAGNSNTITATVNWIDKTAPAAPTITSPADGSFFNTSPITDEWNPVTQDVNGNPESVDHYQIAYNYADGHPFGGTNTCPGVTIAGASGFIGCRDVNSTSRNHVPALNEEGGVTIWVRAIDDAGNVGAWSTPVSYTYDHTVPGTISNLVHGVSGSDVTWNWDAATDATSGVAGYLFDLTDSQGNHVVNFPTTTPDATLTKLVSSLPDDTYTFSVWTVDNAGNKGAVVTDQVVVDTTPPAVVINGYGKTGNVIQPNVTVDGSSTPTGYTYSWTTRTGVTVSNTGALNPTFTVNTDGSYTFQLTVTDASGNQTTVPFSFSYTTPNQQQGGQNNGGFGSVSTTSGNNGGTNGTPVTLNNSGTGTTTPQVLGASTKDGNVQGDSTVNVENSSKQQNKDTGNSQFLGLGWWWLPILLVILAAWWILFGPRRKASDN